MLTEAQRTILARFADLVLPPDDTQGAAEAGAVPFIEDLLGRELAPRRAEFIAFLETFAASAGTLDSELQAHPLFALAVETVHEAYWTSLAGQRLVGFLPTA